MSEITIRPHVLGPVLPRIPVSGGKARSIAEYLRDMHQSGLEPAEKLLAFLDLGDANGENLHVDELRLLRGAIDDQWRLIGLPPPLRQ